MGNDNEMSTAGDVGCRTGGTHHRKKDLGRGGLRTGTDIPQEDRMGERRLKLGPPQYSMLRGSKEIWGEAGGGWAP